MIKKPTQIINFFKITSRGILNPFINFDLSSLGDCQGINSDISRETHLIVSLFSERSNFKNLPKTLYSLLNQSLKPDRIILWLDDEFEDFTSLPYDITQFIKNGLEIKFIKSLGCYTKTFYALKDFPDSIVITANDRVFYPSDWLKKLYLSYISHPEDIQVHKAEKAEIKISYKNWHQTFLEGAEFSNFIDKEESVLYPPKVFSKEAFRKDIFLKYAPNTDNVWLWIMALVNNRKIRIVKNNNKTTIYSSYTKYLIDRFKNRQKINQDHDNAIDSLLKLYGSNVLPKIK